MESLKKSKMTRKLEDTWVNAVLFRRTHMRGILCSFQLNEIMFLPEMMNQVPWAKPRLNTVHTLFNLFADRRGDYSKGR